MIKTFIKNCWRWRYHLANWESWSDLATYRFFIDMLMANADSLMNSKYVRPDNNVVKNVRMLKHISNRVFNDDYGLDRMMTGPKVGDCECKDNYYGPPDWYSAETGKLIMQDRHWWHSCRHNIKKDIAVELHDRELMFKLLRKLYNKLGW